MTAILGAAVGAAVLDALKGVGLTFLAGGALLGICLGITALKHRITGRTGRRR